jgi:hypothetical protein
MVQIKTLVIGFSEWIAKHDGSGLAGGLAISFSHAVSH